MDALSEVLHSVRLDGAVYVDAEFSAPWCVRGECGLAGVRERLPSAENVSFFHFLIEGSCKVRLVDGGEALEVKAGDLILLPREGRHLMGSDLHLAPMEGEVRTTRIGELYGMRHGGGGAVTRFVCGYVACGRAALRPLLDSLPRLLCVTVGRGPGAPLLGELLRAAVRESAAVQPGARSMLAKLAELLFVEAMRRYVESLPPQATGWIAGVRDRHVGRALGLMHAEPARAWTVDALAREAALSRSALAERFTALLGEPPMQYLTRWRLALAAQALEGGAEAIARVARRSGYESEAAFSRAFKREFGLPPAAWRKAAA